MCSVSCFDGDRSVVLLPNQNKNVRNPVGAKNLETVEILEGIDGDEIVVIETPHILRDGQSIQPILVKNKN